jgi:hypothetical protein
MSSPSPRRPSTLAADRVRAMPRPLGASAASPYGKPRDMSPAPRATSSAGAAAASGNAARPASRGAPASAPAKASRSTAIGSAAREKRDHVFVTSIVVAFVLLTVALAAVKMNGSMQQDRSRTAVSGTLSKVYEQQTAFRILNQRFATWPELKARGMTVPETQRVVAANASRSHWFMSVRDTSTGIICSRTGELFDDSPFDRQPSCSGTAK